MKTVMALLTALLSMASPAHAQAPTTEQIVVKDLAGDWRSVGNVGPASIHINEDGTYQGVAATGAKTTGQITVTGGKASYRSGTSEGTVTWSKENGKDVLTFAPSNTRFSPQALERLK